MTRQDRGARLSVFDSAGALDADAQRQVFTPFFTTKKDGQGIGLTLVREILTRHAFGFSLEALPDGRTCFSIGFPPSWTGGSMVTSLQPGSSRVLKSGMTFHAHSWFTNTDIVDYFISNTVLLTDQGAENLTQRTPETLIVR